MGAYYDPVAAGNGGLRADGAGRGRTGAGTLVEHDQTGVVGDAEAPGRGGHLDGDAGSSSSSSSGSRRQRRSGD